MNARPAAVRAAGIAQEGKPSAKEKKCCTTWLMEQLSGTEKAVVTGKDLAGGVWELTSQRLEDASDKLNLKAWYHKLQNMRRSLVRLLRPKSKGAQCKRSLKEARWHMALSTCETIVEQDY